MIAVAAALAAAAMYPAIWNGFPLVFSDSGVYLSNEGYPGVPRFYTIFVFVSGLGRWLFLTLAAQGGILGAAIVIFLRHLGGVRNPWVLLAVGLFVLLANQAPWLASWIMPDFLTGVAVLAVAVLLLVPEVLTWIERMFLSGAILLAATAATANVPFLACLAVFCLAVRWLLLRAPPPRLGTALSAGAIVLATGLALLANVAATGRIDLNSTSPVLMFSRLADTGLAQPVVRRLCLTETYAVCAHLDALDAYERENQSFLWSGVADATDATRTRLPEYAALTSKVLGEVWPAFLREGLADAWRLFKRPTLGDPRYNELTSHTPPEGVRRIIELRYPASVTEFLGAKQQRGELLSHFPARFFAASVYLGYLATLVAAVLAWRRGDRMGAALALTLIAAVFGDLLLHATLVGPYPRYHVKVAWLGWLFAAAILCRAGVRRSHPIPAPTVAAADMHRWS